MDRHSQDFAGVPDPGGAEQDSNAVSLSFDRLLPCLCQAALVLDHEGIVRSAHGQVGPHLRVPASDSVGRHYSAVLTEVLVEVFAQGLDQARQGEVAAHELTPNGPSGGPWFQAKFCPCPDPDGRIHTVVLLQDATGPHRIEQALRESEERFRGIVENTVIGLYRTTPGGRILMVNPALARMLGFSSPEQLVQRNLEQEGFEPGYPREEFKRRIERDGQVIGLEAAWTRRDGTVLHVRESARLVRDAAGRPVYYEGTIEDITEQWKAQQRLLRYQGRLRALAAELTRTQEEERRRIAADLHDNVGQLLVFAKMRLEAMGTSASQVPDIGHDLEDVYSVLTQTIASIRGVAFELSSPVLRELGLEKAVAAWLQEYVQAEHGIRTTFNDTGSAKCLDENLKALLYRSIRELGINAIKHGRPTNLDVSISRAADTLVAQVRDDGAGFEPTGIETASGRQGFGLFSIRERMECLGGSLTLESAPGQGCTARLTVPLPAMSAPPRST